MTRAERLLAKYKALRASLAKDEDADPLSFSPHKPHPKQQEFLNLTCFEALYGGAAGGGKSDALLMAALQYVHVQGYSALLLRRTYADLSLPGAILDRAKEWLIPKGVQWNDRDKRFTFPSGANITFGYLDTEKDRYRYQGAEFQFVGFDEATQFPEVWYRYLLSRLRRLRGVEVPLRARSASNPGGIGHMWVKRRFIDDGSGERVFVPARLRDNPSLDAESYERSLANLDVTTRRQLLDGIWVRDSGGLVYQYEEQRNSISVVPHLDNYLLGIDYGYTDSTAFAIMGWRDNDPTIYGVRSEKRAGMTPSEAAEYVQELEKQYRFVKIVGDIGGLGKGYAEEARRRFSLPIEPAEKNNKIGYISLFNGDLQRGRVKLVSTGTEPLVAEWLELPWNEERSKPADGFEDHCSDAFLYAWRACTAYHEQPTPELLKLGTKERYDAEAKRLEELALESLEREDSEENWWNQ